MLLEKNQHPILDCWALVRVAVLRGSRSGSSVAQRIKYRAAEPGSIPAGVTGAAKKSQHYTRYTSPSSIAQLYPWERMLQRFVLQHYHHIIQLPTFFVMA